MLDYVRVASASWALHSRGKLLFLLVWVSFNSLLSSLPKQGDCDLELWVETNAFSCKLLLLGNFTTATGNKARAQENKVNKALQSPSKPRSLMISKADPSWRGQLETSLEITCEMVGGKEQAGLCISQSSMSKHTIHLQYPIAKKAHKTTSHLEGQFYYRMRTLWARARERFALKESVHLEDGGGGERLSSMFILLVQPPGLTTFFFLQIGLKSYHYVWFCLQSHCQLCSGVFPTPLALPPRQKHWWSIGRTPLMKNHVLLHFMVQVGTWCIYHFYVLNCPPVYVQSTSIQKGPDLPEEEVTKIWHLLSYFNSLKCWSYFCIPSLHWNMLQPRSVIIIAKPYVTILLNKANLRSMIR